MSLLKLTGSQGAHDPVIVKEDGIYYCLSTHGLLRSSTDLLNWKELPRVVSVNPDWTHPLVPANKGDDWWAPEIVRRNGKWRLYYAVSTFGKRISAIGLAESETVQGFTRECGTADGWEDKGLVLSTTEESPFNAIDPAVCQDDDGNDWMLWGSFWGGLFLQRMTADGHLDSSSRMYNVGSRGNVDPNPIEGGFIFKRNGYYYLFASHDYCCRGTASSYHIVVGVSKSITGPYLDDAGMDLAQGGGATLRDSLSFADWAGPGHNTVFHDTDGKDYLVYHAYSRREEGRPHLMIDNITWKNDWPCLD